MTDLRTAAQAALDDMIEMRDEVISWAGYASEYFQKKHDLDGRIKHADERIAALRAALAQPSGWVGLTDDEVFYILKHVGISAPWSQVAKAIEAALRAKNAVPDRVPMTEDEMRDLFLAGISLSERGLFKLIRAVEEHHGIKEQKP